MISIRHLWAISFVVAVTTIACSGIGDPAVRTNGAETQRPSDSGAPSTAGADGGSGTSRPVEVGGSPGEVIKPGESSNPTAAREPSGTWPELQTSVPLYALQVAPDDLKALDDNIDDRGFEVPGTLTLDGRTWSVQVRYRGRSTRYLPKKSFEVKFPDADHFVDGQKALQLLAEWKDGGLLTEKLWWDFAAAAGLRVPKTQYVRLQINGQFYGVMLQIESVKKAFLKAHDFYSDSDLYRCGQFDCELRDPPAEVYQEEWSKKTNESHPWDGLWEFLEATSRTDPATFHDYVSNHFEVHEYLQWLAVDALISNDTVQDGRSYLVWDPAAQRWAYVPWDLNNSVALMNRLNGWPQWPNTSRELFNFTIYDPGVWEIYDWRKSDPAVMGVLKPAWSNLSTRLYDDPAFRAELVDRIQTLLDNQFTDEAFGQRAQQLRQLLSPYLAQDPFIDQTLATNSVQYVRDYVSQRREYVEDHLWQLQAHGSSASLLIQRVGLDGAGAPVLELYNGTDQSLSLGGLLLTGNLRVPDQGKLKAQTIAPGETVRVTAPAGFKLDAKKAEVGLFAADGRTPIDTIFLPPLKPDTSWARTPAGSETWKKH